MKYVNASNYLTLIYTKTQVTQSAFKWNLSLSGEVRTVLIFSPLLISRGSIRVFLNGENRPKSKGHLGKSLALDDMAIFM